MRIAVIGTGVAGALFAAAAQGIAGVEVQAFDRIRPGQRDDAGTGLNIGPNAARALRLHGMDAMMAALEAVSLPWRRWVIEMTDGAGLIDLDLLDVADGPGIRIRWADLYAVLREASAPFTTYDRAFEAYEEDGEGRLTAVFCDRDGVLHREGPFDMLVAADGRYSRLRVLAEGTPAPYFPGIGTWRLLVRDAVPDCPIDDYGQYFCGNARLLSFRLPGGDVYIAGSFPLPGEGPMPEAMKTAQVQSRFFLPTGKAPSAKVAWMLDQLAANMAAMNWARTQEIAPIHQSLDGRILLLGDAAHAMFQTLGQGATQSIEDALVAASILRAGVSGPQAFADAYEARRGARVDFARVFNQEATDTLMPGVDPVAGSLAKAEPPFLDKLRRLYVDVA